MSSGLEWEESYSDAGADVIKSLGSDLDRAHYAANKPLVHEPGTFWAYSTGTANARSQRPGQRRFVDEHDTPGLCPVRAAVRPGRRVGWQAHPARGMGGHSRLPTPTMDEGRYGAQWWLDPERPDLFYANGFDGQSISVAPDKDLVIVVLSKAPNGRNEQVCNDLYDAFGVSTRGQPRPSAPGTGRRSAEEPMIHMP